MARARVAGIPKDLDRYFWDYDAGALSWNEDRHTIISRLLEAGGWEATRWLLDRLTENELRDFLLERKGGALDPKRLRFWELILDLPEERVDEWISAWESQPWGSRGRS